MRLCANGRIVASIPNVQSLRVVAPLMIGKWQYADAGILDRTHLRFFTKESAVGLFEENGFELEELSSVNEKNRVARALNAATLFLFDNFFAIQYLIVARQAGQDK